MDSIIVGSICLARLNRTMACFSALKATKWKQRKPLAVEPPSEQCLSAAEMKALLGDNRQLRKPKQMTAATASEHYDGTLAADVLEQCSPASGREKAAQKAAKKELQSRTLSTLAPIAEATIAFGDTEAPIADATIPDSYLENMD